MVLVKPAVITQGRVRKARLAAWLCKFPGDEFRTITERDIQRRNGTCRGTWEASLNHIYSGYRYSAKRRRVRWAISKKKFREITSQNCDYCGTEPSNRSNYGGKSHTYIYNGIDRKDNSRGYTPRNCVPCCGPCNQIKTSLLTHAEMKAAMRAIMRQRKRLREARGQSRSAPKRSDRKARGRRPRASRR